MGTGLGWEGNRLAVLRTDDPLTAYIIRLSNVAQSLVKSWGGKEMVTSGSTEKCPHPIYLHLITHISRNRKVTLMVLFDKINIVL